MENVNLLFWRTLKTHGQCRCIGELVRKLGDRFVFDILPTLEKGLSLSTEHRLGMCHAFTEIMSNVQDEVRIRSDSLMMIRDSLQVLIAHSARILPCIKRALLDEDESVRAAAVDTFDALCAAMGAKLLEDIVSPLVETMCSEDESEVSACLCLSIHL